MLNRNALKLTEAEVKTFMRGWKSQARQQKDLSSPALYLEMTAARRFQCGYVVSDGVIVRFTAIANEVLAEGLTAAAGR